MLFVMREGIKPTWEDPKNRSGGCFSYKVVNKHVYNVWKELCYVLVGNTISNDKSFVANVTGITISPKKNFCIVKIWLANCENPEPGCRDKRHCESRQQRFYFQKACSGILA